MLLPRDATSNAEPRPREWAKLKPNQKGIQTKPSLLAPFRILWKITVTQTIASFLNKKKENAGGSGPALCNKCLHRTLSIA